MDVEAVGKARPRTDSDAGFDKAPGVLVVSYCLRGIGGSYEDADHDSVRA